MPAVNISQVASDLEQSVRRYILQRRQEIIDRIISDAIEDAKTKIRAERLNLARQHATTMQEVFHTNEMTREIRVIFEVRTPEEK